MKKFLAVLMALVLIAVCFAGCGSNENAEGSTKPAADQTDSEYIKAKGTLLVGITDFEPMDYKDADGNWIGFDADMAKAFAETLGVKVEFVEIDWDNKVLELDGKSIDCVWNGMTLTDEVKEAMSCSQAYCNNAQVVIVKADGADKYKTAEDCKQLKFAVEAGSAGENMAKENGFDYTPVKDQATTLMEIKSGTCDAAIIDSLMAAAMVGEGTNYADLTYTVSLNSEEYGVGFRKGSDVTELFNAFLAKAKTDGTVDTIAEKYGVSAALIK